MSSGELVNSRPNFDKHRFHSKISFRPKRHKLSTNSNPMTLISEGGIELTDATAFLAKAKEKESANGGGGAHKRHQNGGGDEEETRALRANVEVVEEAGARAIT